MHYVYVMNINVMRFLFFENIFQKNSFFFEIKIKEKKQGDNIISKTIRTE